MNQNQPPMGPPPGPPYGYASGPVNPGPQANVPYIYAAPPPQQVHITAKSGGFARAVLFMVAMFLFVAAFIGGIGVGAASMFFSAGAESVMIERPWQDGSGAHVAIIPIEGIIDSSMAEFARDAVNHVLDHDFDAVILRIDSPGGGVSASDRIWYEMGRLQEAGLPVVASYGGIAASGGYYVSCGTDHIIAEPTCITGSIGVIAQVLTLEGLLSKVGIEPVTLVASGSPRKDVANDIFHSWNEDDRQTVVQMLDSAYATFLSRVSEGRSETFRSADAARVLADGSIYTAEQAVSNGLVDAVGYLDDAVVYVETVSLGVSARSAEVVLLRYPPPLFGDGMLLQRRPETGAADLLDGQRVRTLVDEIGAPRLMYLMQ